MVCPAICFKSCPKKRVNSYEASEGSLTLPIHILFYDISFYFVIVDVAVILYAIVLIALIQESILI